jgi:ribosome maturation factor RimP
MQTETQIQALTQKIETLLQGQPSHFLVDIRIKPTNNIKVFIDADEGMPLSTLIDYNRKLYKDIEESGMYPDDNFSLEVSSPGLDEPLKLHRQYKKNIGRFVEVLLNDTTKREGKLLEATEDGIVLEAETGKGKKKEIKQETILFDNIKNTKIQIKF